jgi:hypothetical protein
MRPSPVRSYAMQATAPPLAISNRLMAGLLFNTDTGARSSVLFDAAVAAACATAPQRPDRSVDADAGATSRAMRPPTVAAG